MYDGSLTPAALADRHRKLFALLRAGQINANPVAPTAPKDGTVRTHLDAVVALDTDAFLRQAVGSLNRQGHPR